MPRTPLGTMASIYGHGSGDISSFYRAAQRVSCPNRPFPRGADVGQRKNGRSGGQKLIETRCAWAIPGGIPSGWGQFGAVKKLLSFIGGLRRQLNALYWQAGGFARIANGVVKKAVPHLLALLLFCRRPGHRELRLSVRVSRGEACGSARGARREVTMEDEASASR